MSEIFNPHIFHPLPLLSSVIIINEKYKIKIDKLLIIINKKIDNSDYNAYNN